MPFRFPSITLVLAAALAAPAAAQTASPFDGTWKADLSSLHRQGKPDHYLLKDGTYRCSTCRPAYSVAADGAFHAVPGHDYWDEIAVTTVDDHAIKTAFKKGGALVAENTETVSPDGATLTVVNHNTLNGAKAPVGMTMTATRTGRPIAGAHLISGDWQSAPPSTMSDQSITMTIAVAGGMVHLKTGLNETLDAKIGGGYAPNVGDPGHTMTKVEQPGPTTLRMTDMRGGKVVEVSTYTIAGDGRLHGDWRNPQTGESGGFVATRQ